MPFFTSFSLMLAADGSASAQVREVQPDWLIDPAPYRAVVATNANELIMENGLARRVIRLAPNAATVDLVNLTTGEHVLRAIAPEARITIDGSRTTSTIITCTARTDSSTRIVRNHGRVEPPAQGNIIALPLVNGLHHRYTRQAAA